MQTLIPLSRLKAFLCITPLALTPSFYSLADESAPAIGGSSFAEEVETISVTGTRTARKINEIAASVTTITSENIDALATTNIRDLLRYEPGVSVEGNGRYGLSGFNIRGINGDRVLILIDGIPISDEFSFGPNLSARRDFIDIDLISSVDIVRGPASTLYGSDAIGGVVAFQSKDPKDLLEGGDTFAGRVKLGYASQSQEKFASALLAGVNNNWQWLINASARDGKETESFYDDQSLGSARQSADPQNNQSTSLMTKLVYQSQPQHRLEIIGEIFEQESQTDILSNVGTVSRGVTTLSNTGADERDRSRFSAQYLYQPQGIGHLKRVNLQGFYQRSASSQMSEYTRQSLAANASPSFRTRNSEFEQDVWGLHLQVDHQFSWFGDHYLIYGANFESTDSEGLREGQTQDLASGALIPEFSVFPARDFPTSKLSEHSVFIQDEIQLLEGKLLLSPGIRYDKFTLNPEPDALFETANPGVAISTFEDNQLSKKLGAVYTINENYNLWLQYSEGFRIPPMDDVNIGFTNFAGGYTSLSNPDLKPESVASIELGIRGFTNSLSWSASAYKNDYDDFIESLSFRGVNPTTGLIEFQAVNIDSVEISGIEGQLSWLLGDVFKGVQGWQMHISHSIQQSENKATGDELESILPTQTVFGIQYQDSDAPWRVELTASHSRKAKQVSSQDNSLFIAPSYTTVDLLGHIDLSKQVRLNMGVFNLTDEDYWLASEVRGRSAEDELSRFTSPGRNISANLIVRF